MHTKLTDKEVLQFQAEIGVICAKYGIGALVGIWFENSQGDAYGLAKCVDQSEKDLIIASELIGNKIKKWAEEINPGKWDFTVNGMVVGFKSKKP